jgi:hypothetical protein
MRRITFLTVVLEHPLLGCKSLVNLITMVSSSEPCTTPTIWSQEAVPFFSNICPVSPPPSSPLSKAYVTLIFGVAIWSDEFTNQVNGMRLLALLTYLLARRVAIQPVNNQLSKQEDTLGE